MARSKHLLRFFLDNQPLIDSKTRVRAQSLPFVDLGLDQLGELLWAVVQA